MPRPRVLRGPLIPTLPPARVPRVQIDRHYHDVHEPCPTARTLLVLAGKSPPERFALYEKPHGGQPRRCPLDSPLTLRREFGQSFLTLPLDQTEG